MKLIGLTVAFALLASNAWADFLGTWKSDWNGAIDTTLVVHSVSGDSAQVTYSWDKTAYGPAGSANMSAKVSGKKLSWRTNGIGFVFRDKGGKLSCTRTTSNGSLSATFTKG